MIGTGVLLFFLGHILSVIIPNPSKDPSVWDARDVPQLSILLGAFLILLGFVTWLWRVAP